MAACSSCVADVHIDSAFMAGLAAELCAILKERHRAVPIASRVFDHLRVFVVHQPRIVSHKLQLQQQSQQVAGPSQFTARAVHTAVKASGTLKIVIDTLQGQPFSAETVASAGMVLTDVLLNDGMC